MGLPVAPALVTPQAALARVMDTAREVLRVATYWREQIRPFGGAPVHVENLLGLYATLNGAKATGIALQGTAGLADEARAQLGDPSYDINAEFMGSIIAGTAVTDWLIANLPGDGSGGFVTLRKREDGPLDIATLSQAALLPLASLLDALIATFDERDGL